MKSFNSSFLAFFTLLSVVAVSCNRTADSNTVTQTVTSEGAAITFAEQSFDFGKMNEGDVVEHDFAFTNTGSSPLEIIDVKVQCGCTVASRPSELIGVGQSDKITVRFNSTGKPGMNQKLVTVLSNATNVPEPIKFTAEVTPKENSAVL